MRGMRRVVRSVVAATLLAGALLAVGVAPARSASRQDVLTAAARYARARGYHIGIAVYDTKTGSLAQAGYARGTFASESVVKVFIATRLLVEGRMHGSTAARAYT